MSERRTALIGALLTTIGPVSMAVYTPAMPELVHAFATTDSAIKLSLSLYFAGFACAQLLAGPMSDAFGRRPATTGFLLIYLLGSLVAAFAPTIDFLLAGRLIQGIGASVGITISRAIVRDQFLGEQAARILNLIGIFLAVGPAAAPSIGGLALSLSGWQAVFALMVVFGIVASVVTMLFMPETAVPDRRLIQPRQLFGAYGRLLRDPRVMLPAIIMAGTIGSLYAQAAMLPFIMIDRIGLTPTQFGIGMLMQSGSFFLGSLLLRVLSKRLGPQGSVHAGFGLIAIGGTLVALSVALLEPNFLSIMGPIAFSTFGFAFISPQITTAGLAPHPEIAGSAAALIGFIQMSAGFMGGVVAAMMGDPLAAFGTIIPAMQLVALIAYIALTATNPIRK
ncbi:multidrug effflux MFS transporter [Rhizobium sp. RU36D]|uniref:multidrug effflux MFS transporter n=1 Tax=Rhizobium sp. RU36D TaxID=1907415 RepID=UPI0009FBD3C5|nr:multidrug effflux MFS transporter [Rhizobium sp. RU36D]